MHAEPKASPSARRRSDVGRAAQGDRAAIERIYAAEVDALYAFVHPRVGGRPDVAEDVVQAIFLTAFRRLDTYDPQRASLQVWLRLLSRNVIRSRRRADAVTPRLKRIWGAVERRLDLLAPLPDDLLIRNETRDLVQMALALLPVEQQQLLRARFQEGRSNADLADELQLGVEAVRSRVARARKAFRRAFTRLEETLDG